LRAEAHGAAAAHHVDRFDIGQADGRERQLRLAKYGATDIGMPSSNTVLRGE